MISASARIKIPFHDVDSMGVTWHGHYVKYLEIARCELLDKIGYNYKDMEASGYAWPIIDMHIRYPGPTLFDEEIDVTAKLVEWENRLVIDYQVRNSDGRRVTKARTVQVALEIESKTMCYESPAILLEKIKAYQS